MSGKNKLFSDKAYRAAFVSEYTKLMEGQQEAEKELDELSQQYFGNVVALANKYKLPPLIIAGAESIFYQQTLEKIIEENIKK